MRISVWLKQALRLFACVLSLVSIRRADLCLVEPGLVVRVAGSLATFQSAVRISVWLKLLPPEDVVRFWVSIRRADLCLVELPIMASRWGRG